MIPKGRSYTIAGPDVTLVYKTVNQRQGQLGREALHQVRRNELGRKVGPGERTALTVVIWGTAVLQLDGTWEGSLAPRRCPSSAAGSLGE